MQTEPLPGDLEASQLVRTGVDALRTYDMVGVARAGTRIRRVAHISERWATRGEFLLTCARAVDGDPSGVAALGTSARRMSSLVVTIDDLEFFVEVMPLALARTAQGHLLEPVCDALMAHATRLGVPGAIAPVLLAKSSYQLPRDLVGAESAASLALELADATGTTSDRAFALARLAIARGLLGDATALEHAAELDATGNLTARAIACHSRGLLHLTAGRNGDAVETMEQFHDAHAHDGSIGVFWQPDLVEAASRTGDDGLARRVADDFDALAASSRSPYLRALALRARGWAARDTAEASEAFAHSVELFDESRYVVASARATLAWAVVEHRDGRSTRAETLFDTAATGFARAGATMWVSRCREQRAALTGSSRSTRPAEQLTVRQLQIARWVADGATYQEIADRLRISRRTVESHVAAINRMLGIRTRAQLAALARHEPLLAPTSRTAYPRLPTTDGPAIT